MKKCYVCGDILTQEKINITRYWGSKLISLENVPAMICKHCGERYFEAKVSAEIDQKIKNGLQKKDILETIIVPVVQF